MTEYFGFDRILPMNTGKAFTIIIIPPDIIVQVFLEPSNGRSGYHNGCSRLHKKCSSHHDFSGDTLRMRG
jgi:hypothetical protein